MFGTPMIARRPALLVAVASTLLTACATAPAPVATASLPAVHKKTVATTPAKKATAAPVATAYDGVGSKSKCGERHLAYQAGKTPEATMQEKVARDLECTPL
jgi:hypothetical protein